MCIILVGRQVRESAEETRDVDEAGAIVARPGNGGNKLKGSREMVVVREKDEGQYRGGPRFTPPTPPILSA